MSAKAPILSIVICTYNREEFIGKTLEHLARMKADPAVFEVIIVNNNSTDRTEQICRYFIEEHPVINIRLINETQQGLSYARNRGIDESRGQIIAYIDDDAFVREDYADQLIHFFQRMPEAQAVGGKVIPVYQDSEPKWMSRYLLPLVSALDMGHKPRPFRGQKFPIGANVSFRKAVFGRLGGFNVKLGRIGSGLLGGEEKEIIMRLKKHGEPVWYAPDVVLEHIIPPKRLQMDYIRGLAEGVGVSETQRLKGAPFSAKVSRFLEELIKIGGTLILFLLYLFKGQADKGWMLLKFRYWVVGGFLKSARPAKN